MKFIRQQEMYCRNKEVDAFLFGDENAFYTNAMEKNV